MSVAAARPVVRDRSLWVNTGARFVQLGAGFGSIMLLVRALDPVELGIFYMVSAIGIALALSPLSFLHFPIQRLMPDPGAARDAFLASIVRGPAVAACGLLLVYFALRFGFAANPAIWAIALIGVYALAEVVFAQGTNLASALERAKGYFWAVAIRACGILVALAALGQADGRAADALVIYAVAALAPFFITLPEMRRALWRGSMHWAVLSEIVRFGWPFALSNGLRQIVERGDRLIIGVILGPAIAGQYSVAVDLARRIIQGTTVNARLTYVRSAVTAHQRGDAERLRASLRAMSSAIALFGLPVAGTLAVFGERLIAPIFGPDFDAAAMVILPLLALAFVLEAYRLYLCSLAFELARQGNRDMLVSLIGAAAQIGLVMGAAAFGDLRTVAVALIVTQLVMLTACVLLAPKTPGFDLPWWPTLPAIGASLCLVFAGHALVTRWPEPHAHALMVAAVIYGAIHLIVVALIVPPRGRRP